MIVSRRMVIFTEGYTDPYTAKTAVCLLRYRPADVVAVLDRQSAGRTAEQVFGTGGSIPCVAGLAEAIGADCLVIGIAPPGGKLPNHWRPTIMEAIGRGWTIISGLHDFLSDDPEFARAAAENAARLVDLRRIDHREVAGRTGIDPACLRIHTVGNDCSCGKMVSAVEIARGLCKAGIDAAFVATGQTGILVAGDGCPVDRVIADFLSGAAEKLVLANQHHEVIVVEGQGSLFHPRYSCVSLGLLHGLMPHGLIFCYEMGRREFFGMAGHALPDLEQAVRFYETAANIMHPCRVIGVAVNGGRFDDAQVAAECERTSRRLGLPACDVLRHGPGKLVDAVLKLKSGRDMLSSPSPHILRRAIFCD